jgi:hypothetical protein
MMFFDSDAGSPYDSHAVTLANSFCWSERVIVPGAGSWGTAQNRSVIVR